MKFSLKLTLAAVCLLALCLSLCGYLLVRRNTEDALALAIRQNAELFAQAAQQLEQTAKTKGIDLLKMQQVVSASQNDSEAETARAVALSRENGLIYVQALTLAAQEQADGFRGAQGFAIFLENGSWIYSNMPKKIDLQSQNRAMSLQNGEYLLAENQDGGISMLLGGRLMLPGEAGSLLMAFDVTPIFASRQSQLRSLRSITAVVLAFAAIAAALFARRFTRPLVSLEQASRRMADGDYDCSAGVCSDDEIGALSQSFERMSGAVKQNVDRLQQEVRKREEFIAALSHELKTPMTSMVGYAALLRSGEQPEDTRRAAADAIWRETRRLESLSGELIGLVGLRAEPPSMQSVELHKLFYSLQKTLPPLPAGVKLRATTDGPATVRGNLTLLDDLLRNLVLNAVHACGEEGEIEIGYIRKGKTVELFVRDNGCGMPPQELERITEPFYMVDKSRSRASNGSGLGLAICSQIAALHQSKLRFESEPGKGTTVRLCLQAAQEVTKDAL